MEEDSKRLSVRPTPTYNAGPRIFQSAAPRLVLAMMMVVVHYLDGELVSLEKRNEWKIGGEAKIGLLVEDALGIVLELNEGRSVSHGF